MSIRSMLNPACLLALAFALPLTALQRLPAQQAGRLDRYGDRLPDHALMRIGTTRMQPNVDGWGDATAMAFTRDGKRLVTINQFSGVQVWDAVTGKKLLEFGKPAIVGGKTYALSADGGRAAVIESKEVCRFYDTADGKEISAAAGNWDGVKELRFSPSGKLLGVSGEALGVAVWEVARAAKRWHFPIRENSRFGAFAFASDEQLVVFAPRADDVLPPDPREERRLPLLLVDLTKGPKPLRACAVELASGRDLAFSPDGKLLAADDGSSEFILKDFATGKLLHEPKTVDDMVWCRCFSPNGKWIVTGSNHGRVRLWDVTSGKLQRKLAFHDGCILSVAFSPDGKRVAASSSDGSVRVWDVFDFEGHCMRNVQAWFSSDGKTIVSTCGSNYNSHQCVDERTFRFWDSTTGKPLRQIELGRKKFLPFCHSDDGRFLFVIDTGEITKQNLVTGTVDKVQGLPTDYSVYRSSADGKYLAAHTDSYLDEKVEDLLACNFLRVVDSATGKAVLALDGNRGEHLVCDFTPDGRFLAVHTCRYELVGSGKDAGFDLKESYRTLWELSTGRKLQRPNRLLQQWKADSRPSRDRVSPSTHLALTRGEDGVDLRELATNAKVAKLAAGSWEPESGAFSRDGKFVAVGNEKGQIVLWSVFPPEPLVTLSGHSAAVTSVHFSPDGKRLVSGSDDTTILTWTVSAWTTPAAKPVALGAHGVRLWHDLADPDAVKAYAALGELLQSPRETVGLLRQHLRPAGASEARQIARLIADLDSERFAVRDQAMAQLQTLGFMAFTALEKALSSRPSLEARRRSEQLLAKLETQPMSGKSLQATRALQALEVLGTADAVELLNALASGDQAAWLTHEAALALARMGKSSK